MPRSFDELRAAIDADPDRRARVDEMTVALVASGGQHQRLGDALAALIQDVEHYGQIVHQAYHAEQDGTWQTCSRGVCGGLRRAITRAREALGEVG